MKVQDFRQNLRGARRFSTLVVLRIFRRLSVARSQAKACATILPSPTARMKLENEAQSLIVCITSNIAVIIPTNDYRLNFECVLQESRLGLHRRRWYD
jgi:hypothetical protein